MKKNSFILITICLAFCLILTSCGKKKQPKMRYLKINIPEDPMTLDPRKGGDVVSSLMHSLLYEGLTKIRKDTTSDLGIADKVDLSEDRLTYTFYLRPAKWSDGSDITAYDYEYTWKSMLDPQFICPNINMLYFIKNAEKAKKGLVDIDEVSIKALDNHTLVVSLEHPTPFFLNLISFCSFSAVKADIVKNQPNWADNLSENFLTCGPFKMVSWKKENEIILEKNPDYWDEKNVKLQGIHISIINDDMTAVSMFEKGQLDILGAAYSDIPLDTLDYFKNSKTLTYLPVSKTVFCSFNTEKPPFNNKWIRKAFSLAINRPEIVETVAEFKAIYAQNFITPVIKKGINNPLFEAFNAPLASIYLQKGLDELNMTKKDLETLIFSYTPNDVHTRLTQAIQSDWKKNLGVHIRLQSFDKKLFFTKAAIGDYDVCLHFFAAQYDDPMNIFDRFRIKDNAKNFCKWENDKYKDLLFQSYFLDEEQRNRILDDAERVFIEDMPLAPIYHSGKVCAVQPYVKGFYTSPIGSSHFDQIQILNLDRNF